MHEWDEVGTVDAGFNCAESSNLAPPDWLQYGAQAVVKYKLARHLAPLSHDKYVSKACDVEVFYQSSEVSLLVRPTSNKRYKNALDLSPHEAAVMIL